MVNGNGKLASKKRMRENQKWALSIFSSPLTLKFGCLLSDFLREGKDGEWLVGPGSITIGRNVKHSEV